MEFGDSVVIDLDGLDKLIHRLADLGYDTRGPVVRDGAIMPGTVRDVTDLPAGYHDEQRPGEYALIKGTDTALFGWAVGPGSWKGEFFPPRGDRLAGIGRTRSYAGGPARRDAPGRVRRGGRRPSAVGRHRRPPL